MSGSNSPSPSDSHSLFHTTLQRGCWRRGLGNWNWRLCSGGWVTEAVMGCVCVLLQWKSNAVGELSISYRCRERIRCGEALLVKWSLWFPELKTGMTGTASLKWRSFGGSGPKRKQNSKGRRERRIRASRRERKRKRGKEERLRIRGEGESEPGRATVRKR